jgi:hypothetical protein
VDFYKLRTKRTKDGIFVYPDFVVQNSKDLLIKGRAFYAIWDDEKGLWSRDEMDVARKIDEDLNAKAKELDGDPWLMSSYDSNSWKTWKNYIATLDDSDIDLDVNLTFADDLPDRKKHSSRRLPYSLTDAPCSAWDELVSTLYHPVEREKIEWAIGSIISGDSKSNQKFLVFYGPSGHGKSTILRIMENLFEGYSIPVDMKAMGSLNNGFSLSGFKNNPLLAFQHDGDLSRIEDNTKLNSIVSHEMMPVNEKYKAEYYTRSYAFLALGTNEPVKISGSKSGIIRRLIDVHPSGNIIPNRHYHALVSQIDFELGAIAQHCLNVYRRLGKNYYAGYKPTLMMYETDVFYNYVEHFYDLFYTQDGVTLEQAWQLYKEFCDDALIRHKMPRHQFRSELLNYFDQFDERADVNGVRVRSYYSGFKTHRFLKVDDSKAVSIVLDEKESILDGILKDMPAQYATSSGVPKKKWDEVKTKLSDIDTKQLHYVMIPENHIIIDFDLKDEDGKKSSERNLEAAAEWPPTYAEFSQGQGGVHLHYYYDGPGSVADLRTDYKEGIEVKTLPGNSALRRRLSLCNNVGITTLSSGLPLKEKSVHDAKAMTTEKSIRELIIRNLRKEIHPGTKPSVEFIKKILDDAYDSGIPYDVSDLYPDVYSFAMDSTNHARHCMKVAQSMQFMSADLELKSDTTDSRIAFYDVEVFPNLFVICWKFAGEGTSVVKMINPTAQEVEEVIKLKLIGYNCRRYDNHIAYAAAMGYSIEQLYDLSQRIVVAKDKSAFFGAAYDLSYADIYDYSSKKQSLKKWEIDLGLPHIELSFPWDQPVPEEAWLTVAEYCANDVLSEEAVHEARKGDFVAREILAELSGLNVNNSTQQHTAKIVFGNDKNAKKQFIYTDLSKMFPGYKYDYGKSTYRDEVVGEGGYVYAEPGYYKNVALLDVASMHPTSIELLDLFGPYTEKFSELKSARILIKRGDFQSARTMLDGKLASYLEDEDQAEALAYALKIVINTVYGLTSATFDSAFRDPRNKDNIVAKRGALFMIDLKHFVQEELGLPVIHIKTDSIKVPDASDAEIQAIMDFGAKYGYEFEHEATYSAFVLFNDAVYIARKHVPGPSHDHFEWIAVGAQFQHPYVYKKLLSSEEITFDDLCETRNVTKGAIYVDNGDERRFVGRIGRFVPMLPDTGGGALLRVVDDKAYAVTGTKGYEWLEADAVKSLGLESCIDYRYFDELVEKALKAMQEFGFEV